MFETHNKYIQSSQLYNVVKYSNSETFYICFTIFDVFFTNGDWCPVNKGIAIYDTDVYRSIMSKSSLILRKNPVSQSLMKLQCTNDVDLQLLFLLNDQR